MNIVSWYLTLQLFALAGLPLAFVWLRYLPSRGYTAAKALGLLLSGVVFWWGGLLGLWGTSIGAVLFSVLVVGGVGLLFARREWAEWRAWWKARWRFVLVTEGLFAGAFLLWAAVRALQPQLETAGGEKWMEIAFLNAVLRSPAMPPRDPWLSGFAISYYYLGYVLLGMLTRLSGVPATIAFNLGGAGWYALAAVGAYGIVYDLLDGRHKFRALTAPLLLLVTGNGEGFLEVLHARGLLPAAFWRWLDIRSLSEAPQPPFSWIPTRYFWWWQASRTLHDYIPGGEPEVIDEFPAFSFILGDMHPHVLGLPFVLLVIALALNLYRRPPEGAAFWKRPAGLLLSSNRWQKLALGGTAVVLGTLGFLNTWDFPIYWAVLVGAWILGGTGEERPGLWTRLAYTLPDAAVLGGLSILFTLPFWIGLRSQASGILPNLFNSTRPEQFAVMFAPLLVPVFGVLAVASRRQRVAGTWVILGALGLVMVFLLTGVAVGLIANYPLVQAVQQGMQIPGMDTQTAALANAFVRRVADPRTAWIWTSWLLMAGVLQAVLVLDRRELKPSAAGNPADGFALLLVVMGMLLTLVPELIYLRDLFGSRMNTVFKFYFQAWVVWSLAGAWWLSRDLERGSARWARGLAWLLVAVGLVYTPLAALKRAEEHGRPWTLDGAAWLAESYPGDWQAIQWLNANVPGQPFILEAPGDQHRSYVYEGRVSALTGLPTVLGWGGHENQWRGTYDEQLRRESDLNTLFTTPDPQVIREILARYQVRYLYVGPSELTRYQPEVLALLPQLFPAVYSNEMVVIYQVDPEP